MTASCQSCEAEKRAGQICEGIKKRKKQANKEEDKSLSLIRRRKIVSSERYWGNQTTDRGKRGNAP